MATPGQSLVPLHNRVKICPKTTLGLTPTNFNKKKKPYAKKKKTTTYEEINLSFIKMANAKILQKKDEETKFKIKRAIRAGKVTEAHPRQQLQHSQPTPTSLPSGLDNIRLSHRPAWQKPIPRQPQIQEYFLMSETCPAF